MFVSRYHHTMCSYALRLLRELSLITYRKGTSWVTCLKSINFCARAGV